MALGNKKWFCFRPLDGVLNKFYKLIQILSLDGVQEPISILKSLNPLNINKSRKMALIKWFLFWPLDGVWRMKTGIQTQPNSIEWCHSYEIVIFSVNYRSIVKPNVQRPLSLSSWHTHTHTQDEEEQENNVVPYHQPRLVNFNHRERFTKKQIFNSNSFTTKKKSIWKDFSIHCILPQSHRNYLSNWHTHKHTEGTNLKLSVIGWVNIHDSFWHCRPFWNWILFFLSLYFLKL